jgi:NAD(P)-dependent dehydrogenase (short-subunit alcohol dehydrogenase family)
MLFAGRADGGARRSGGNYPVSADNVDQRHCTPPVGRALIQKKGKVPGGKMKLEGQSALVTGASSGLGAHFVRVLAENGASVVAGARNEARLDEVCAGVPGARPCRLDVTDRASVEAVFAEDAFDIVVNNAGISVAGPALDYAEDDWQATLETNLTGCFRVAQCAARAGIAAGRGGSIVNVASILGLRVAGHVAAYAAAKAGLVQFTRAAALEWARHGIRVNALCPGLCRDAAQPGLFRDRSR